MENMIFKKEEDNICRLLELPDYLINNYIFPYLSKKELFLNIRAVHPYLNKIIKDSLGNNYKEDMKLRIIKERNILITAYENKIKYLINIRNLLLFYNVNSNMLENLKLCIDYLENENILKLIIIFSEIFFENDLMDNLLDNNINIDIKKNILLEIINKENTLNEYILRLTMLLDLDNDTENDLFSGLKLMISEIDTENVEIINESCRLINSFLVTLFNFQELKKDANHIKIKVGDINEKI